MTSSVSDPLAAGEPHAAGNPFVRARRALAASLVGTAIEFYDFYVYATAASLVLGAPVGFIAANGFFLVLGVALTPAQFASWGWRLPFLASVLLVAVGLWVRLRLAETPAFAKALAAEPPPAVPLSEVLRDYPGATIAGTFAVVVCFALFYLTTAFALGYGTGTLHYDKRIFLGVQIVAILGLAAGIFVAGAWSDRASPRRVLVVGCLASVVLAAALAPMLGSGSLFVVWLYLTLALFTMGFVYGPLGAFLPSLFPARVRYTGASLAFNLGGILGGGLAPFAAQALADRGGLRYVGAYLAVAALINLGGLAATRETRAPHSAQGLE